jgi:hypothetical protein
MKVLTTTTIINIFNGITNIIPLVAFLNDSYFGCYKTLAFASEFSLLVPLAHNSLTLFFATSLQQSINLCYFFFFKIFQGHDKTNVNGSNTLHNVTKARVGPTAWQLAFLLAALNLLVVGARCIRTCNLAFGVGHFNPMAKSGKRGYS